jgi:hypothetical protein
MGIGVVDCCGADSTTPSATTHKTAIWKTRTFLLLLLLLLLQLQLGYAVAHLVDALCYKPEGRGLDSWWCHWNFLLT